DLAQQRELVQLQPGLLDPAVVEPVQNHAFEADAPAGRLDAGEGPAMRDRDAEARADIGLVGDHRIGVELHVGERPPEDAEELLVALVVERIATWKTVAGHRWRNGLVDD